MAGPIGAGARRRSSDGEEAFRVDTDAAGPDARAPGDPEEPARARGTDRIVARVVETKGRLDATRVGHVQRHFVKADLANQAMILAALALSLLVPVLVTLAAVVPLGAANSLPGAVGRRLGLTVASTQDLQRLFPTRDAVRGSSTVIGGVFTVVSAYAWPTALQRAYEITWGLGSKGWRGLWRPLVWLTAFIAFGVVLLALPASNIPDPWRTILLLVFWTPIVFVWSWWTQHFLLRGAVGWRLLLPGALAMTVGLIGLRAIGAVYLSAAISSNYHQYGPLGLVFMLLTWLIALSMVMLGGPVLGAAMHEYPQVPPPYREERAD
jgi:membrane protein